MGRFINPFTDVGFKRIFGQEINKDLLIDFLNSLLEGEKKTKGPEKVKMTVTYEDEAGKISKAEKELQLEVAEAVETTEWDEADMKPAPSFPFVPVAAAVLAAAAGTTAPSNCGCRRRIGADIIWEPSG